MKLLYVDRLDSTNAWLASRWRDLAPLTAVFCGTQRAGRGRLDRRWLSDCPENLYLSILFKPATPPFPAVNLTQYASVALCRLLDAYGVAARIKWPNDVLVGGCKIAGTLSQMVVDNGEAAALVLGLGVNLNAPAEFLQRVQNMGKPATSLHLHLGEAVDRDVFAQRYLETFMADYDNFANRGFASIKKTYILFSDLLEKTVTIGIFENQLTGIVKQITDQGSLVVEESNGRRHTVTLGDMA